MKDYQKTLFLVAVKTELKHVKEYEKFYAKVSRLSKFYIEKHVCLMRARDYEQWASALIWVINNFKAALKMDRFGSKKSAERFKKFLRDNKPSLEAYSKAAWVPSRTQKERGAK